MAPFNTSMWLCRQSSYRLQAHNHRPTFAFSSTIRITLCFFLPRSINNHHPLPLCFTLPQVRRRSFSRCRGIRFEGKFIIHQKLAMLQKLTIPNNRGEKLSGVLHETGSEKLVVLCHGFQSTKEYNVMVNIATALENEGISAFRFDFSGNGESEGSFEFGNYLAEVEDLRSVVEYFTGSKRLTVAVIGHSKGGDVVLLYASKYHDIPAVVNLSGRYDLKRGLAERLGKSFMEQIKEAGSIDVKNKKGEVEYKVTLESLTERLNTNMHEACLSIDKNCKVLTVHGSADEVIPVEDAHEFAKIIPNHRLQIIEGANHGYSSHQDQLVSAVLPFIKGLVQTGSDTSK